MPLAALQVAEFFRDMGVAYVLNPGIQFTLISSHLDSAEGATAPRPDGRHWEQVARKISITQQQLDEIAACWKQTRDSMVSAHSRQCMEQDE